MQKSPIPSKDFNEKEVLSRAASLCSRRECCVSEIRQKLAAWGASVGACDRIIDRLTDEGFIDEARFARAYALDKLRYNHWGRVRIDQSLRLLGIDSALRRTALDELPPDEYRMVLRHLIDTKLPTIKAATDYERNGKLLRFLAGRGFEQRLIFQFIQDSEEL